MKGIKYLYAGLLIILFVTLTSCGFKMGKIDITFGQKSTPKVTPNSESRPIESQIPNVSPETTPEASITNISGGARAVNY